MVLLIDNQIERKNQSKQQAFDKTYNKALKALSYRPRSEKEIAELLAKKKFDESIIFQVIVKLKEQKLVNDKEFAKWWIEQRQLHKVKSTFVIKQELREKGIDADLIDNLLEQSQDDYQTALAFFEKKKKRFKNLKNREAYKKAAAFLQRRGFSWEITKKVLETFHTNLLH